MFSKTFRYGLQAAILLSRAPEGEFLKVRDLSRSLGVPKSVLAKTLHTLGQAGVIETLRGPKGGCRWNPGSDSLSLADLVRILDSRMQGTECFLGLDHPAQGMCVLPGFTPARMLWAMDRVTLREVADRHGTVSMAEAALRETPEP
ncbi:MAG: Rrf2 family transcriptional regulator [Rhodothermales bacterium]|nr:Rrf2 family transcriptional regulator [Rhodothermales bacterium]MBO6780028.1 Rrf2 family transcriptional regulator [Rhodothermales bacterium]